MLVAGSAEDLAVKRGLGCGMSILPALTLALDEKLFDRNLTADMPQLMAIIRKELAAASVKQTLRCSHLEHGDGEIEFHNPVRVGLPFRHCENEERSSMVPLVSLR
jgi:hypothetical protein